MACYVLLLDRGTLRPVLSPAPIVPWREQTGPAEVVDCLGSATVSRRIVNVRALEILDSRGQPTLRVWVELDSGVIGAASVPSGASTGEHEAVELRDGAHGPHGDGRYDGKGVRHAVTMVQVEIGPKLHGMDPSRQAEIDHLMVALDGTGTKSRLGANAILGVSMAVARAAASACGLPLYAYLGGSCARRLPVPMMNVINGGRHAANRLDFQEFMLVPHGAPDFREALRYGAKTFAALRHALQERGLSTAVGDEGGFAPDLASNEDACGLIVEAIRRAGFKPWHDIAIALDPAASSFWSDGAYRIGHGGRGTATSEELTDTYAAWVTRYPIVSIEDGHDEHDWEGFKALTALLGRSVQIVGDDLYVTNARFIQRGIAEHASNAVLIKLNQIGTVTETVAAIELCREAGWRYIVSHRSGETEDTFIADFAVAMGGGQIKTGSLCRSERIAKYNRLLEIEQELGMQAEFRSPFAGRDVRNAVD